MENASKATISNPSILALNIYYYYSSFTLFISWILGPFLIYLILKKSKTLKSFKWYILNQTIWCFIVENIVCLTKPVLLTPAPAGYSIGILQSGGSFGTGVAWIVGTVVVGNCILSVQASIGNRYLTIFPNKLPKWCNYKNMTAFGVVFSALYFIGIAISCFGAVYYNSSQETAKSYDPFFENFHEPSLFFPPPTVAFHLVKFGTFLLAFSLFGCLATTLYFIYLVKSHFSKYAKSNLQRSLIISCIVQILLTCAFLIFPFFLGFCLIFFQVPNSATIICLKYCIVSTHSIVEFLSLLYFVTPYRKYCLHLIKIFFSAKPVFVSNAVITSYYVK